MMSKLLIIVCLSLASSVFGWAPIQYNNELTRAQTKNVLKLYMADVAESTETEEAVATEEAPKLALAQKKAGKIVNERGVEYAPWMDVVDEETLKEIKAKREARDKELLTKIKYDPATLDIGSGLLKFKVEDDKIILKWATDGEPSNKGFILQKRTLSSNEWITVATYETDNALVSQGASGGTYFYKDESSAPGGWVYQLQDVDINGKSTDMARQLIEYETAGEAKTSLILIVLFVALLAGAFVAGFALDPMQS